MENILISNDQIIFKVTETVTWSFSVKKNFKILQNLEENTCHSLFNKVADLRPATVSKKKLWHSCLNTFFPRILRWLLLETRKYQQKIKLPPKTKQKKSRRRLLNPNHRSRSTRWQMFFKIGALKNFPIFSGKQLSSSLFEVEISSSGSSERLQR